MRVVLVRLSALGDIIHTWPLAEALRALEPRLHLTWIVEEHFRPLVDGHPAVDAVLTTRTGAWRRRPLAAATRAEIAGLKTRLHELQPDLALDPQGLLKSALVSRWTGAPRRVGLARPWRREWASGFAYTETFPGAAGRSHVASTTLELVRSVGAEPPPLRPPDGCWLRGRVAERCPAGPWSGTHYATLLPGAGGAHKLLSRNTLVEVCRGLSGLGLTVVVAWGPGEAERAAGIARAAEAHLAPPTNLEELSALLAGSSLTVGGDTGPVHLAAALDVPTVAVFLTSDWRRNGPLGLRTAVVSGAREPRPLPSGSARTGPGRAVAASEIVAAARGLLA